MQQQYNRQRVDQCGRQKIQNDAGIDRCQIIGYESSCFTSLLRGIYRMENTVRTSKEESITKQGLRACSSIYYLRLIVSLGHRLCLNVQTYMHASAICLIDTHIFPLHNLLDLSAPPLRSLHLFCAILGFLVPQSAQSLDSSLYIYI